MSIYLEDTLFTGDFERFADGLELIVASHSVVQGLLHLFLLQFSVLG